MSFLLPSSGTVTAKLTYPTPSRFKLPGLQLCHDGQAVPGAPSPGLPGANATDGGKDGTDTFRLKARGCGTQGLAVTVSHGNTVIHHDKSDH